MSKSFSKFRKELQLYEQNNSPMSMLVNLFNQFKKKSRIKGVTGLPTFSNADPRFKQRLSLPQGDDEENEGSYENPWQNAGPQYGDGGPFGNDPDWDRKERRDWSEYYDWLDDLTDPNDILDTEHGDPDTPIEPPGWDGRWLSSEWESPSKTPTPNRPTRGPKIPDGYISDVNPNDGPEGTIDSDDLFDPWKYRGVTNMHSLYYDD